MLFSPKEAYHFKNKPSKSIKRVGGTKKTINFTVQSSTNRVSSLQLDQLSSDTQSKISSFNEVNFQE
jgi:hypothetical protein